MKSIIPSQLPSYIRLETFTVQMVICSVVRDERRTDAALITLHCMSEDAIDAAVAGGEPVNAPLDLREARALGIDVRGDSPIALLPPAMTSSCTGSYRLDDL